MSPAMRMIYSKNREQLMNKDRLPSILQKTRQNRGASRAVVFVLCTAVVLCMLLAALLAEKTYTYDRTDIVLHNPYCGFAPMADDENEVGDNTLVYVEVTWKEWEPEKGVYDTASLRQKYHLDRWQAEGKKIVLRFVCDLPGEEAHRDIPDWLYDVTKDGTDYTSTYGKGYSPDYTNEVLITEHAKAIQALGNYFDQEERTAYVELGSLGHWGEWHVDTTAGIAKFPSEATAARYVEPYLQAFTAAKLMMRRPFSFVSQYGMGLYNDMTGDEDDTNEWLDWIANGGTYEEPVSPYTLTAVHALWDTAPIGGEFTSGISMHEILNTQLSRTLHLLDQSHMTFVGPKIPTKQEMAEDPIGTKQVLAKIGYRYGVSKMEVSRNPLTGRIKAEVTIQNFGTAPLYADWPVMLDVLDKDGKVLSRQSLDVKLSQITNSAVVTVFAEVQLHGLLNEAAGRGIAIEIDDPSTMRAAVHMDMENAQDSMIYPLYEE